MGMREKKMKKGIRWKRWGSWDRMSRIYGSIDTWCGQWT